MKQKKVLTEKAQRELTETAGRDSLTDWFCKVWVDYKMKLGILAGNFASAK